jgi:alpha-L-fucosidase
MLTNQRSRSLRRAIALAVASFVLAAAPAGLGAAASTGSPQSQGSSDNRMDWWREARFGMFIHWGLYSIPAGEWKGQTNHAEWIMHTARIPVGEYERLMDRFNPVNFDANEWVRIAKEAGVKYIVITTKHHDGFCLFDSKHTEYDVMSTPFARDIMKEMADACHRQGIKICWYYSIMDWHHPDYLPRRNWESRSAAGADYNRYIDYVKNQLTELVTHYGEIGVLWFDGGWEHPPQVHRAGEIIAHLRELQPSIIINARLEVPADFDTPEQFIPSAWRAGRDWESCITMNDHWGYNKFDSNWKSTQDLIRMLADTASKGGNLLLNVGPTPAGEIPQPSIERLREMGQWMKVNGDSIYGTKAGPFASLPWGRCTQRALADGGTRLYLHVFDWPKDGKLPIGGLSNEPRQACVLADTDRKPLRVIRQEDAVVIDLPPQAPDAIDTVVVLDITGPPEVVEPPSITADSEIFVDTLEVSVTSECSDLQVCCTTDGSRPNADSALFEGPLRLADTATVSARLFRDDRPVSPVSRATFTKVEPRPGVTTEGLVQGLLYDYFEADWDRLPSFDLLTPVKAGTVSNFDLGVRDHVDHFGFRYTGFVVVPRDGVYTFYTDSDDGSRLWIGDELVVDNDGLHVAQERSGQIALAKGAHLMTVTYFDKTGDDKLEVSDSGPGVEKQRIPDEALLRPQRLDDSGSSNDALSSSLARPTPHQLEWQDREVGMFIHFAPNTWLDKEYDDLSLPLSRFNPEKLDTDQWVAAAEAMGAKFIIFVAKHAGGFCMWQTDTTDYSLESTPWRGGKGDVLADLAASCRKKGMKLGVYLSPQDKKHGAGGGGRCDTEEAQDQYDDLYRAQLTEVLSRYGEISEVWFDGSTVVRVGDILSKYAPNAMIFQGPHATIRWVGNEDGFAPYPAWNSVSEADARSGVATAANGDPNGTVWLPNECDARMRNTWFWRTDNAQTLKTVDQLMEMYYRSVGHGAVLLLNQTPDPTGLIPEADFKRGAEFGAEVARRFGQSIAETSGKGDLVELSLKEPTLIDHAIVMEEIAQGERVREYVIEGLADGEWTPLCQGTAIGHKKIERFAPAKVSKVRLRVLRSAAEPLIRKLAV